jgi:hypothetical protein
MLVGRQIKESTKQWQCSNQSKEGHNRRAEEVAAPEVRRQERKQDIYGNATAPSNKRAVLHAAGNGMGR